MGTKKPNPAQLDQLMTTQEVADYLGTSKGTLEVDRYYGRGLPYVRFGRRIRYRASDIAAYLEANLVAGEA
ncbi:helix-turn-helix domain-containing protein [Mycobacterium sp. SM3041]|uniref:helix-turn-helix domain-containing protein n=1 Tax=Mycobacterium sp. SM3041 TaxID=3114291 RepID=UPI0032049879